MPYTSELDKVDLLSIEGIDSVFNCFVPTDGDKAAAGAADRDERSAPRSAIT